MADIQEGHPCRGMDCKDCVTCRFDVELFPDGVQPNKKKADSMDRKLCNGCVNLERNYEMRFGGRFDAACKVCTYEALGSKRARRIDFNVSPSSDIVTPDWCPLKDSKPYGLPSPSTVSSARPKPQETGPHPSTVPTPTNDVSQLTYAEKRERLKTLPKHLEWNEIQEGHIYVIPKIMSQCRKIVKVLSKTEMCCSCHEISETTGNEYQYICSVYPSDLEAVFITEIHNF